MNDTQRVAGEILQCQGLLYLLQVRNGRLAMLANLGEALSSEQHDAIGLVSPETLKASLGTPKL